VDEMSALKEKIVINCKVLQHLGMVDGFGHMSVRLADNRILSTPLMPPGKVALRDLIILDKDGKKLEGYGEPNGETAMHTSVYKARPDVQCILHYHPDELVAVSVAGVGIKVVANCSASFYRGVPIYDSPMLIVNEARGDEVARTLGDRNAVLLRGHGGTVVAADLDNLLRLGINLVRTARIQIMASSLGPVKTHSDAEAESIVNLERSGTPNRRFFDYYLSEVVD
jgi:ribulose-5-phosphate 4-epimerase/fuculose-1-phosphate aldolase